jgi:hypothetical protein
VGQLVEQQVELEVLLLVELPEQLVKLHKD